MFFLALDKPDDLPKKIKLARYHFATRVWGQGDLTMSEEIKPETTSVTKFNEFEASLWHFIGQERTIGMLKNVINQFHNDIIDGRNL